jgi:GNAT superfamily N-acetyltransferase
VSWTPVPTRFFRKLRPFERSLYLGHLRTLTGEDRRRRFQLTVGDDSLVRHVEGIDFAETIVLGCFVDGVLRGAAEVAFERASSRAVAELGVSIEPVWQGQGLGGELTRRALRIARNRGAKQVWMFCLPDNEPMRRIAKALEGQLELHDGTLDARLPLSPANAMTRLGEQLEDGHGLYGSVSALMFSRTA